MLRTTRRLAPIALFLGLALLLAVAPAQARENPAPGGWFSSLTHQLMQWTAGWWGWAGQQAPNRPLSPTGPRPPVTVDCGGSILPDGCPPAIVIRPGAAHSGS